jgi:hypothetical protein
MSEIDSTYIARPNLMFYKDEQKEQKKTEQRVTKLENFVKSRESELRYSMV